MKSRAITKKKLYLPFPANYKFHRFLILKGVDISKFDSYQQYNVGMGGYIEITKIEAYVDKLQFERLFNLFKNDREE